MNSVVFEPMNDSTGINPEDFLSAQSSTTGMLRPALPAAVVRHDNEPTYLGGTDFHALLHVSFHLGRIRGRSSQLPRWRNDLRALVPRAPSKPISRITLKRATTLQRKPRRTGDLRRVDAMLRARLNAARARNKSNSPRCLRYIAVL